jgi:NAD(P)-dependent dehydrogenase (short-subunit alcohol dehydrogenase family)
MTDNPLDFTDRVAIVTGGTKGLGKVIAQTFLAAGAEVVICARREPDEPMQAGDRTASFVAADVRDPEQCAAVVDAAVQQHGRLDVLVNNAGGAPPAESATVSPRFNEKIVALNLLGPMQFAQAAHAVMSEQGSGGVIINISSVSGTRANPMGVAYGAAKAGLANMTQTLAHEWGPKIRVLTITVGMIVTEEAEMFYGDEDGVAAVGETLALKRMGTPADIADVCLFAASPLARWMTGTDIEVHGGGESPAYLGASTGEVTK